MKSKEHADNDFTVDTSLCNPYLWYFDFKMCLFKVKIQVVRGIIGASYMFRQPPLSPPYLFSSP